VEREDATDSALTAGFAKPAQCGDRRPRHHTHTRSEKSERKLGVGSILNITGIFKGTRDV
jgi:hypothetical protein